MSLEYKQPIVVPEVRQDVEIARDIEGIVRKAFGKTLIFGLNTFEKLKIGTQKERMVVLEELQKFLDFIEKKYVEKVPEKYRNAIRAGIDETKSDIQEAIDGVKGGWDDVKYHYKMQKIKENIRTRFNLKSSKKELSLLPPLEKFKLENASEIDRVGAATKDYYQQNSKTKQNGAVV